MGLTLQRGKEPHTGETIWLMLDDEYQVVAPLQQYLTYLSASKSPNTVEAYGYDLKAWWEFLGQKQLDWRSIKLSDMEDFAYWLRVGEVEKVISLNPVVAQRSERSVNRAITAVTGFYEYHIASANIEWQKFERFFCPRGLNNKGLLTGIARSKPRRQKLIKLKEPRKFPGCLTDEQVETLVNSCRRLRDKLLILMLNSTGMRKGELLGLCHEDIGDFGDNSIKIVQRVNPNGARTKGQERVIPVPNSLLEMYNDYLIYEYPTVESDYVFVNIWEGNIGAPINPNVLNTMFSRLSKKTGIKVYPHLFRHTYATRLLRAKYPVDRVKYLLGHSSIQTTLDIYSHILPEEDLRQIVEQEEEQIDSK